MTQALQIGDFVGFMPPPVVIAAPMPQRWYILRMHPNYDLKAERQLHERGISAYVPKETQTVRGCRKRKVTKTVPIFPGSMFIPDFDADIIKLKANADGIGGFIQQSGKWLEISLGVMGQIRGVAARLNRDPMKRKYHVGQRVRITKGIFEFCEGEIERVDSRYRLSVLIEFLGAKSSLQLDEDGIEAV